jgi:hypothetical protein
MPNLTRTAGPGHDSLALTADLELRLIPVVRADSGAVTHVEIRLFRRVPSELAGAAFLPTAAGFRLPLQRIPEFIARLSLLAEAANLLEQAQRAAGAVVTPTERAS